MKIVTREQFIEIIEAHPFGGVVFAEYTPDVLTSNLMVTEEGHGFGAIDVIPSLEDDSIYNWDWNIYEDDPNSLYVIFDEKDVLRMITVLTHNKFYEEIWS